MRIRTVPSEELSPKSLRASDYVPHPRRIAKDLVTAWCRSNEALNRKSKAVKQLEDMIETAIIDIMGRCVHEFATHVHGLDTGRGE